MESITTIFVKRLNLAFETIQPSTPEFVQKATNNAITGSYIRQLRAGNVENPSIKVIGILSEFFKVPPSFFLESDPELPEKRQVMVDRLVHRFNELEDDELQSISMFIDVIKSLRGRDNPSQKDSES